HPPCPPCFACRASWRSLASAKKRSSSRAWRWLASAETGPFSGQRSEPAGDEDGDREESERPLDGGGERVPDGGGAEARGGAGHEAHDVSEDVGASAGSEHREEDQAGRGDHPWLPSCSALGGG